MKKLYLLTAFVFVLCFFSCTFGQRSIFTSCPASVAKGEITFNRSGDLVLTPCIGKNVLINGVPYSGGGIIFTGAARTGKLSFFANENQLSASAFTYSALNGLRWSGNNITGEINPATGDIIFDNTSNGAQFYFGNAELVLSNPTGLVKLGDVSGGDTLIEIDDALNATTVFGQFISRGGVTMQSGDLNILTGNANFSRDVTLDTTAKLKFLNNAGAECSGTGTLVAGTRTITTSCAATTSKIQVTPVGATASLGTLTVSGKTNGSFTVSSTLGGDVHSFDYLIIN